MSLNAGIIGGGVNAEVHAAAVRGAGHRLAGLVASSAATTHAAAQKLCSRAYTSTAEMLADPNIDVVHICTPNATHGQFTRDAVAAGKRIICEKPLSTSLDDALALTELVRETGTQTAVPFVYRFYPLIREMRSRVGDGGRILMLRGSYLQDWLADADATNWRVSPADGGPSRAFADIGVHLCDLLEFVSGERIASLTCQLTTSYARRGGVAITTEDIASVLFRTTSGIPGALTVSQVSLGQKNRLVVSIDATNGSYEFDQENPDRLTIGGLGSSETIFRASGGMLAADAQRINRLPAGHPQGYQDAFTAFVRDAYASFGGAQIDGLPTFADGLRAAVLTDAVMRSASMREWVDVPEPRLVVTSGAA